MRPEPVEGLAALEQAVPGGVTTRLSDRLAMAHDASHYLLTPQAVVTPRTVAEVAALFRAGGPPLTFRSGGTSLSGQSTADGVLVDVRRHFRGIEVLDEGARVRVQPGAVVRAVNVKLGRHGRKLGPDPASESACTIGGVVANNSSGMACGTELNSYATLTSAVVVLPSGTVVVTGARNADARLAAAEPDLHAGLLRLRDRVRADPRSVAEVRRLYAIKNTMGYGLNSFLDHDSATDILAHLMVGSEGTLGFVAEATFRTVPVHPYAATGLLIFPTLAEATAALPDLVAAGPATVELLDAASLRVAQHDPQAGDVLRGLAVDEHTALLVEFQSASAEGLAEQVGAAGPLLEGLALTVPVRLSSDPAARAGLWHIRKGLYTLVAGNRPTGTTALLEDIAVPVDRLRPTCDGLNELFARHRYADPVIFGHALHGNLHFLLNEHFEDPDCVRRYLAFTEDLVDLVLDQGGTLKAEHGTGRIMAPYVRRQFGDELYAVMVETKRLFDPAGRLSPGVLIGEDPAAIVADLKPVQTVEEEVDRCVECGYCEPVCPSRDLTTTPRRRIVLRREIARARSLGQHDVVAELERDYDYDAVQTCAVDGLCETACPVLINTGDLVTRLRAEEVSKPKAAVWSLAAKHWGAGVRAGGAALTAVGALPGNASVAVATSELARKVLDPDTVPRYDPGLPGGGPVRRPRTAAGPVAVYAPACIGTIFGPEPGPGVSAAFLALCERAGVEVTVPEGIDGLCCGTPWKSKGMLAGHGTMRDQVAPVLARAAAGGLPVVVDAASCTEGFGLLLARSAEAAGLRVVDAVQFTDEVLVPRLPPPPRRVASLALHPTCSSARLGLDPALRRVAAVAAQEVVVPDDWGCCAFAGDRGLLHPELTAAATAPEAAELRGREFAAYASVNRTCELGMTRATGHPYRHVLEILADAYVD